jgi:SAM-dependent methyltransferase
MTDVFWRAHTGLPREAPGSEATTRLLLRFVGALPPAPAVLDVGCGTGPASILLAQLTGGHVTAVDLHEPFLARVTERARAAGVADRVEAIAASMDDLPVADGSVDLLWAEGSAYLIGFDTALATWRPLLSPAGVIVLTEAEWLTPHPAPGARAFWDAGYPAMRTTAGNVAAVQRAGWDVRATYLLPDSDWNAYYGPLARRLGELRAEGVPDDLLAPLGEEIEVRAAHGTDYGYTGYVLRPRR